MTYERIREGKATTLGAASGAIAGAVAITPACAYVTPLGALAIGILAGGICAYAVSLKYKFNYDDSLDVVGVHGVGGFVGMISIGLIATTAVNEAGANGLFIHGSASLLTKQLIAALATAAFSFVATFIIATVISKTIGFRVTRDIESEGLDTTIHAESAYEIR
jgi:Amt family ammonium transporter